jgi:hypothetical protein
MTTTKASKTSTETLDILAAFHVEPIELTPFEPEYGSKAWYRVHQDQPDFISKAWTEHHNSAGR